MADDIDTTARALLACICDKLTDVERPACACFATIGPPVVGLCCTCDTDTYSGTTTTGDLTIHVERLYDADPATLDQTPRVHPCRRGFTVADFSIVLTRCYPMVDEQGQMPDTDAQDEAATTMHLDLADVYAALTCGCNDYPTIIREIAVDSMPEAGCSALAARVTVEVKV